MSTLTFNGNVSTTFATTKTLTLQGSNTGNNSIGGIITNGTATLNIAKSGTGTWILANTNSYTGSTALSNGSLILGAAGAVSGGTLTVTGGSLTENVDNAISGAAGLTMNFAANTLTLSRPNNYTGTTTLTAGTVNIADNSDIGSTSGTIAPLAFGGGTLQYAPSATNTDISTRTVTFTNTAIIDTNGNNVTLTNAIGGAAAFGLTKNGAGTLYLRGTNAFGGAKVVTVNGGVLKVDNEANLGAATNTVLLNNGTLEITTGFTPNAAKTFGVGATVGTLQVDAGTLLITGAGNGTTGLQGSGAGQLVKSGAGTLALTGTNSFYDGTGGFRIDQGTLSIATGATSAILGDNNPSSVAVHLNGGTLSYDVDANVGAQAGVTLDASSTIQVNRATAGVGVTDVMTSNAFVVNSGGLTLNVTGGANVTSGTAGITLGSTTLNGALALNVTNPVAANTTTLITLGAITNNGNTVTLTGTGSVAESAATVAGAGGFTQSGSGTLTLNQANLFTGLVTVNSGTVVATSSAGALGAGTAANTVTLAGGILKLTNATATNLSFSRNTTVTANAQITSDVTGANTAGDTFTLGTLAIGGQTLTVVGGANVNSGTAGVTFGATTFSANPTFSITNPAGGGTTVLTLGALADGGTARTITQSGTGTLTLSAAATSLVTGTTFNVNGGILTPNVTGSLSIVATTPNTTTVNVNSTGELRGTAAGSFKSTGTSTPSEAINLSGGTVRLFNAGTTDFGGNLTYTSGTLTLDRTASGLANTDTMGTLSIGGVTLTPTTVNYTTIPTLVFGNTTLTGNPTFDSTNANINIGALSDGGTVRTVTSQGANTLTLTAAASALQSGTTFVTATGSTLSVTNAAAMGTSPIIWDGGTFASNAAITVPQLLSGSGAAGANNVSLVSSTLTIGDASNLSTTIAGVVSGSGGLTKAGTATLTLTNTANTDTGITTLSAGTLVANANNVNVLGTGAATLVLNGGTLDLQNDTGLNYARNTTVGGTTTIQSDVSTFGATGVTHTLGTLSINNSTLNVAAGANVAANSAYGLTFGNVTLTTPGPSIFNIANNGSGIGTLTVGAVTGAFNLTIKGAGNFAQTAAFGTGAGASVTLDSTYTGTTTFNQTNLFQGGIALNGGTLIATTAGSLGPATNTVTFGGAGTANLTLQAAATTYTALLNVARPTAPSP